MHDGQPSRTALRVALRRAAHQVLDDPRVFEDPLALAIVGADAGELRFDEKSQGRISRATRAFMAVRSRYAEDGLAAAFEVDHPATQGWKRHRLEAAGIAIPESMTFAPVDFESQTLAEGLARAGFRTDQKPFFSWRGVVPYLTRSAAMETLRFVASLPPGSEIVFDYALPPESLDPVRRQALDTLAARVAASGEPFQTFFAPSELKEELRRMGFASFEDLGTEEINARYFNDRSDGLRIGGGIGRLMKARVG
jgi:O-methyltransferase involved in polyketide biosynthesis